MTTSKGDEKYRRAVDVIAANCGAGADALVTSDPDRFPDRKVRALAGTAPEYQRHVLGRAMKGDANPFGMLAATLLVYDTVAFKEVTSRLDRALGMVRREVAWLERARGKRYTPDRVADRVLTLDLIAEQAGRLRDLLTAVDHVEGPVGKTSKGRRSDPELTDKLHAAGGLGLIAKNVRNVAALLSAHRPTPQQKETALRLTAEALQLAVEARDATRRAFGRLDAACRERPASPPTRRVITHDKVDGDAVAAAWLAERFLFAGEAVEVLFVRPKRVWGAWRAGDCVVDAGGTHDPEHLFFDHRPPAFGSTHDSCAARLVWDRLVRLGRNVQHLRPLVNVVYAGDSVVERGWFKHEFAESQRSGFHKALKDSKSAYPTDDAGVYRAVRQWLDRHATSLATRRG